MKWKEKFFHQQYWSLLLTLQVIITWSRSTSNSSGDKWHQCNAYIKHWLYQLTCPVWSLFHHRLHQRNNNSFHQEVNWRQTSNIWWISSMVSAMVGDGFSNWVITKKVFLRILSLNLAMCYRRGLLPFLIALFTLKTPLPNIKAISGRCIPW